MIESKNYSALSDDDLVVPEKHQNKITEKIKSFFSWNQTNDKEQIGTMFEKKNGKMKIKPNNKNENVYKSQKYNVWSFVPLVMFEQFRIFYNFYFLLISVAYIYPPLRMGVWWTNFMPITFFLAISFIKEGYEDYQRKKRDDEVNDHMYERVNKRNGELEKVFSKDILPGDIIVLQSGQRVPADMILFGTEEKNDGTIFIKTDQLDGETDWKLRRSIPLLRGLNKLDLVNLDQIKINIAAQSKDIHDFSGTIKWHDKTDEMMLENTLWSSTVLASGSAIGFVIYTGSSTKFALNAEKAPFKTSLFETEANNFAKLLFAIQLLGGIALALANGIVSNTFLHVLQFILLLSYILPVSLRVNLDMGKSYYSYKIKNDKEIKQTTVRNVNVCEELGRISYLLTDKTGTLTLNQMNFKKLKVGQKTLNETKIINLCGVNKFRSENEQLCDLMKAMALCHNVTPTKDENDEVVFQGSSSDEIALVEFAKRVGYELVERDNNKIVITTPNNGSYYLNK